MARLETEKKYGPESVRSPDSLNDIQSAKADSSSTISDINRSRENKGRSDQAPLSSHHNSSNAYSSQCNDGLKIWRPIDSRPSPLGRRNAQDMRHEQIKRCPNMHLLLRNILRINFHTKSLRARRRAVSAAKLKEAFILRNNSDRTMTGSD